MSLYEGEGGGRKEERLFCSHTYFFELIYQCLVKAACLPLPAPTRPITAFSVTELSFTARTTRQACVFVFLDLTGRNAHRRIADHLEGCSYGPQKNQSQPGAETLPTFFCLFGVFLLLLRGGSSPSPPLFFSAGIQTVFVG